MKTRYFEKVENKYIFNLSLIFWHLFILLGTIAIIGSILLLAYSLSPTFKAGVEKAAYPPEVEVELKDLDFREPEQRQAHTQTSTSKPASQVRRQPTQTGLSMAGYSEYQSVLDSLKALLPNSMHEWEAIYKTVVTNQRMYLYHNKDPKYTKQVLVSEGIQGWMDDAFEKVKTKNYHERAEFIRSYILILGKIRNETARRSALYQLQETVKRQKNVQNATHRLYLLEKASKVLPLNDSIYRQSTLWDFDRFCNDHRTGQGFVDMLTKHLRKFDRKQRALAFYSMRNGYREFNNINVQSELTTKYLTLLPDVPAHRQAEGLDQYYSAHKRKNAERDAQISRINSEYARQVQVAENDHSRTKAQKKEYRLKSIIGIGGGVAFISVLAILLVFLSIQRSVRKIEEKVDSQPEEIITHGSKNR